MAITLDGTNGITTPDLTSSDITVTDIIDASGIYLGGTGSANKLDDYEEGTWAPVMASNGFNQSVGTLTGNYRKVGSVVFVACSITFVSNAYASAWGRISGLPFAAAETVATAAFSSGSISANGRGGPAIASGSDIYYFPADNNTVTPTWNFSAVYYVT